MLARANNQAIYMGSPRSRHLPWYWIVRVSVFIATAVLVGWGVNELQQKNTLPIKQIHALGTFNFVNDVQLRDVVARTVKGGFFGLNVNEIKSAVQGLPWVAQAEVRRVWPDTVAIHVTEQTATAVWAEGGLVNKAGALFNPQHSSYPQGLPVFVGPRGMERNMSEHYRMARNSLAPLDVEIAEFRMDARRALTFQLSNDIELVLGREHTEARLQRFVRVYQKVLATRAHQIKRVDMRYSHGLAVAWRNKNNG